MAVRTTGAERAAESAYVPGPLLQIVQAILWRAVRDFGTNAAYLRWAEQQRQNSSPGVKRKKGQHAHSDTGRRFLKAFAGLH